MGRRCHRHRALDGRQPEKSAEVLWWSKIRCWAPRAPGCRYLLQKRPSLQLRYFRPLAEGSPPRGHVGLGDEWEAVTKDPWTSITSSGLWLYWGKVFISINVVLYTSRELTEWCTLQECQMARPHNCDPAPLQCSCPEERVPLLYNPSRQTQLFI